MKDTNSAGAMPGFPQDFLDAAIGPVTIPMNNDYLFRALLQRSNYVLKGLTCSLLHPDESEVKILLDRRKNPIYNIGIN